MCLHVLHGCSHTLTALTHAHLRAGKCAQAPTTDPSKATSPVACWGQTAPKPVRSPSRGDLPQMSRLSQPEDRCPVFQGLSQSCRWRLARLPCPCGRLPSACPWLPSPPVQAAGSPRTHPDAHRQRDGGHAGTGHRARTCPHPDFAQELKPITLIW